ncbi:DUF2683 family protein [Mucilaginibacter sp. OK283]|jgi:hypothetical protein|uniref:DUF2683 family protein n=1 Tax=Mucilaginibacter sp. OK283 TaxID=1881049 RepID=UPI0008C5C2EE|nr:DUF2683 family protein [Mucilaginibacter sp. OK283]SEP22480.1 hypothetical protein SAMN05428947_108297 [Mucilaginibacter sp. OK283]
MTTLVIYPDNKEKYNALKGLMKAFNIPFEEESTYDPQFVNMILQGEEDLNAGKGVSVDVEKLF